MIIKLNNNVILCYYLNIGIGQTRLSRFLDETAQLAERWDAKHSCTWVEVHDPLSLSLLPARLNELSLGVEVREYLT